MKVLSLKVINKISNSWLMIIAIVMPFLYYPFDGIFNAYIPRFIFLSFIGLLFLPIFIINSRYYLFHESNSVGIKFLFAYYVLLIISTLFATDKTAAIIGYYRLDGILVMLIYFMIFFVSRKIKKIERKTLLFILCSACLICIHAISQKYFLDPIPESMLIEGFYGLSFSTMGNPNYLGSFLSLIIPFSFYLYVEKDEKLAMAIYCLLFYALLCTRTRGAWLGAFAAFFIYLVLKNKYLNFTSKQKRKCLNVLIVSVILVIILSLSDNFDFVLRILSIFFDFGDFLKKRPNTSSGGYVRLVTWGRVIEIIRENPFIGIGTGNLGQVMDLRYREYMHSKVGIYQIYDTAHNEYLHIAVTSGIPSLLMYLGFVFTTISKSISKITASDFYLPVVAALIGYLIISMFNNSLIMFEYLIWIMFGVISSNNLICYLEQSAPNGINQIDHGD